MLWVLRSPPLVRNFEHVLRGLAERGHAVHVAFEGDKPGVGGQRELIDTLAGELPALTVGSAPRAPGALGVVRRRARTGVDYLRYLEPRYRNAHALRERAAAVAPPGLPRLGRVLAARPGGRQRIAGALRRLEAALPPPRPIERLVARAAPDVLLVSPLMRFGSPQPDYVRAARRLGIPSALVVYSWDNLTNTTLMHELPDRVLAWNEIQAREAAEHHAVPAAAVEVTGAPGYDHWFGWKPVRVRDAFCAAVGLDPSRPYLLYVGSSPFIAPDEPQWVAEWLAALRSAPGRLRDAGVLIRPHPLNAAPWARARVSEPGRVAVFPPAGAEPANRGAREDYFDSLHHAAGVVGINTTALVESAIVGRGTYTVHTDRYRDTQQGTLHFHHLRADRGGPLHVAATMDEHLAQLEAALGAGPHAEAERLAVFVQRFVRPHGLAEPAAPRVVAAIERLAAARDAASGVCQTGPPMGSRDRSRAEARRP